MDYKLFQKRNDMTTGKILLGVLAGAAAGAILGILFAPDKGSVTRKKIVDMANDFGTDINEKFSNGIKGVMDQFENTQEDAKDLVEFGKSKVEDIKHEIKNTSNTNVMQRS